MSLQPLDAQDEQAASDAMAEADDRVDWVEVRRLDIERRRAER